MQSRFLDKPTDDEPVEKRGFDCQEHSLNNYLFAGSREECVMKTAQFYAFCQRINNIQNAEYLDISPNHILSVPFSSHRPPSSFSSSLFLVATSLFLIPKSPPLSCHYQSLVSLIIRRDSKMKRQNNGNDLSNFHLQLFSLEEQEAAIQDQPTEERGPCMYSIQPLPISISMTASFAYFALFLIWFILLLDSYLRAYAIAFNTSNTFINTITSVIFGIRLLGYVINGGLLGAVVVTLGFYEQSKGSGVIYILWYVGSRVFPYTRYLVEGFLLLTSYFAYVLHADLLSIVFFLLAILLSLYYTVFLQNITLRKDEFCCKSLEYSLLFRLCLVSSMAICIITGGQVSSGGQLAGCAVGHLLLSALLVGCYFSFGLTIYRHRVARLSLFAIVTLYFCLSASFLVDLIATRVYNYSSSNLALIGSVMVLVGQFFFLSMLDGVRRDSNHPSCKDVRQKVFFSFNKYEMADEDEEIDCEIRGVMNQHYMRGCRNPDCIVNLKECYDSKKKKKCAITKIAQGKVSVIKFFVKCLYETAMGERPNDLHLQLDYLQFYYLKLKNVFTTLLRIGQLQHRYLNFHQRLRLTRLKDYLTAQSNEFSRDLYDRALSICNVIRCEETFQHIQQLIDVILARNELFWKYLSLNEVHLREIIKILQPNFRLLDKISSQWTLINQYFPINRRWKFYFICFTVFIRNEKVKPAAIEDFGNSVQYDSIFKTDNYFVDKTTEKELLYNPIMLFEQNTCYLHARCDEEKMVITRVSNFFQRNLDYEPQEIVNSSLTQLMSPSVRNFHHPMFLTWVKEARSSNQAYYQIKKIYPLTKRGYLYPCFKFYKRYIQISGEVEYIAMLKSNRQDEQLMLLNSDYEVEAITLTLHHKLRLRQGDYIYLKGINLLALMPMLAKYTRLCSQIKDYDDDFLEDDDNQNYFKRQGTIVKGKGQGQGEHMDVLHERKLLNLANIKVFLPNDFQSTLEFYKQMSTAKKLSTFDAVRELYHWIRREKNFSKFKAEICIREREMMGQRYYQVQINELQQNNRLQKLRTGEVQAQQSVQESCRELQQNRLNEIDMQLFFSMSKKKNKVILFPSKNIFLKDENNRALLNIAHIDNINIFIRISLLIFLSLVLAELMLELSKLPIFLSLTNQYYQLSRYQKVAFMLNSQYNIQHIQPGNSWEQSFIIIAYTHTLFANYASKYFQALIYDSTLNRPGKYHPYYPILPTNLSSAPQPSYDQFAIFFQYFQNAISLHREAEIHPQSKLETLNYYQFNNYVFSFREKAQEIKAAIQEAFHANYQKLRSISLIFGGVIVGIMVGCLLFSLSRLWKVINGFKQLVSILIQIDNSDLRDIAKYVDYTRYLFDHLNQKNQRMGLQADSQYSSTSGNFRSFQKRSSQATDEEQRFATSAANLNKRIKKIEIGNEITCMIVKPAAILLSTIAGIGIIIFILNIYSTISLDSFAAFQQLGFTFMETNGINNIIANGAIEKYRGSVLYNYSKYQSFLKTSSNIQSSNANLKLTIGPSAFQQNLKTLYYDNFCRSMSYVFNETLTYEIEHICDGTNAGWCENLYDIMLESNFINRCETIQSSQLMKGTENYNNFFLKQMLPFFNDIANLTLQNIVQINDANKLIDYIMFAIMQQWADDSGTALNSRSRNIIIIVVCVFISTVLLNVIFIEIMVKRTLREKYEIFRLMHQHYIPEWIIVKEKIIKVKLIKEGFMKE